MGFQVLNMRGRDYHVLSIAKELRNGRARVARQFGLEPGVHCFHKSVQPGHSNIIPELMNPGFTCFMMRHDAS